MKKKTITAFVCAIILVVAAAVAFAHPPKAISAAWDASNQMLNISAEHSVNDPAKHYVLNMTIFQGGKQLLQKQYTSQATAQKFQDSVALKGMSSGTKIRIQVVCNIMGSTETEFTIP